MKDYISKVSFKFTTITLWPIQQYNLDKITLSYVAATLGSIVIITGAAAAAADVPLQYDPKNIL